MIVTDFQDDTSDKAGQTPDKNSHVAPKESGTAVSRREHRDTDIPN